jgi:hypothetical protein
MLLLVALENSGNPENLEGGTIYVEGAAGYLFGGTGSFMLLGVNRELLLMGVVKPDPDRHGDSQRAGRSGNRTGK